MKNKKIFLTVSAALILSFACNAQRAVSNFSQTINQISAASGLRNVIDTIMPVSFIPANQGGLGCFTGVYTSDSGYVTGNNAYGDFEKAQFYDLAQMGYAASGSVQSVMVKFAYKTQNASPEDVVAKIYSVDTSGFKPGSVIGISQPLNLSSITTNGEYSTFQFDASVQVGDSFFVSMELPRIAGDTLVILSTQDGCVEKSGWSWEQWSDATWHSISASWIRDIDLAIFPVIDLPFGNGIADLTDANSISVYPNPATDFVRIYLLNEQASSFSIRILNMDGTVVRQINSSGKATGNPVLVPLDGVIPALYFLEVASDKSKWRSPLCVVK